MKFLFAYRNTVVRWPFVAVILLLSQLLMTGISQAQSGLSVIAECGRIDPLYWRSRLVESMNRDAFSLSDFADNTRWQSPPDDLTGGYLVTECFGEATPPTYRAVLHDYPPAPLAPRWSRPVLLVGGAGDNALRSLSFLAVSLSRAGFSVYALTFAHRHGDNFQQAEIIANTIAFILDEKEAAQVDVVAYSKGTVATRIFAGYTENIDYAMASEDYAAHGTPYDGEIKRLILLGGPHAGLDTVFRWSGANLLAIESPELDVATAWTQYRSLNGIFDLSDRSIYALETSPYLGQAQLLADLSDLHVLPGLNPSLGAYALQQDYFTTYYGGVGFQSTSLGIERAIEDGGHTIELLAQNGVAADIDVFLAAGGNPIMSVGGLSSDLFETFWSSDDAAERRRNWEELAGSWIGDVFPWGSEAFQFDLPRLFAGTAFLGEISGPSDGLVFTASALDETALTAQGASVVESKLFEALNHAELIAAGALASEYYGDEETAGVFFDEQLSAKYALEDNQAVEWVMGILKMDGPTVMMPPDPMSEDAGGMGEFDVGLMPDVADLDTGSGSIDAQANIDAPDGALGGQPNALKSGDRFEGCGCTLTAQSKGVAPILSVLVLALMFHRRKP